MKLSVFLKGFIFFSALFFSTSSWALYPDKEAYPRKDNFGVYIGAGIGTASSNTFGLGSKEDYVGLYAPTRTLSAGVALANMGIRLWDIRFEGEYSNFYQWYSVMNDQRLHTSAINSNNLPNRGQEALTGFAANIYYDMRFISDKFYPYIGAGIGKSTARYTWIDTELQPNGLGQAYSQNQSVGFTQLMVGLQYDLRIIKSSFSVEYRFMKASGVTVRPGNDGLSNIINDSFKPGEPDSSFTTEWTEPVDKNVSSVFHSVIFSIKYYLY
ncbi:MAG: outer membrane beta-barrel protein [Alphaproteobacteria bacterium]|nr:outer membrane beta-barrel protein [Alphaproteobacteria bacterium]